MTKSIKLDLRSLFMRSWNDRIVYSKVLLLFFLFAILSVSVKSFGQAVTKGTVAVTIPTGGFGMDGDLRANTPTGGIGDWLPGTSSGGGSVLDANGNPPINSITTFHKTDAYVANDNVFAGGQKKNDNPNTMTWITANPTPSKCDINNVLVHIGRDASGDTWIFMSGDRASTNGNSFISIALHQKMLSASNGKFFSDAPNSTGGRTVGDVQISAEFTGGGSNPNLYLEEWKQSGSTYQWSSTPVPSNSAFGSTNAAAISGVPYDAFGGSSYTTNAFIEVAFNISAIYRSTSTPCVGSISSMFVMTKSSQSVSANLTDFIDPIQIDLDINVGRPTANGAIYCVGNTIAALTASGEQNAVFKWYSGLDANGNATGLLNTGASYTPNINNNVSGSYDYYVTQSLRGCEGQARKVTVTVNPNATASAGTAPTAQCYDATSGNTFLLSGSGTNGSPSWAVAPGGNPNSLTVEFLNGGATSFTPSVKITGGTGSVTFLLTVTSPYTPSCGTPTSNVTVTVNPNPTANAGTAPDAQCYDASGNTFSLDGSGSNGIPRWTVAPNGNSANLNVSFSNDAIFKPTVIISGNSSGGSVILRLTVTSSFDPSCGNDFKDVTVTVNPNATASAGTAPTAQCYDATSGNTFLLSGSGTNGSPSWAVAPGGNPNSLTVEFLNGGATSFTPSVKITGGTGSVTFLLTVTSPYTPSCGTPTSNVTVTVNPNPTANAGTAPDAQCYKADGNIFALTGSGTNGTPSWAVAPGGNPNSLTVEFLNGSENSLTPSVKITSGTSGGSVTLRLTVNSNQSPSCGSKTSEIVLSINAQVSGPNVRLVPITCTDVTFKVEVTVPVGLTAGTYTLKQVTGGHSPITKTIENDAVGGKIMFEELTIGKGYSVTLSSGGCTSAPTECGNFNGGYQTTVNKDQSAKITDQEITLNSEPKTNVTASPNPFNDRIRFTLKSNVSGQGSLELFNTLGQKVKTVFQGQVIAGQVQTIEYSVPQSQRTNLIYLFRVGTEKTTGKLVGLK